MYKQDTSDKIDYSKYYFLPSQLRTYDKNDNKDLFTFKLTPEEKHYHACLSHSFVLNEFCPPGVMHRIIAVLLREVRRVARGESTSWKWADNGSNK